MAVASDKFSQWAFADTGLTCIIDACEYNSIDTPSPLFDDIADGFGCFFETGETTKLFFGVCRPG